LKEIKRVKLTKTIIVLGLSVFVTSARASDDATIDHISSEKMAVATFGMTKKRRRW
jgi:hypothetical protein